MVIALGTSPQEQREWAEAWDRVCADRENAHRAPVTPTAAGGPVPRQLPTSVDNFTGRGEQILELDELLLRPQSGAVAVISGVAGVGKTALALQWAQSRSDRFPDGHLYVDLHGFDIRSPLTTIQALRRFLRALGLSGAELPDDEDELGAQFRSMLAGRRMLILIDNAADTEQVRELLPGFGSCAVLVTSRDSLTGLIARHGAHRIDLDVLPPAEAAALLRQLGLRGEATELERLADRCARLPLALRVAAEQLDNEFAASAAELVDELSVEDGLLDRLEAGNDPRTDLRVVLGWSYDRLPEPVARAYRLAALHPGPDLSAGALAALLDVGSAEAQRALVALTRLHLVRQSRPGHLMLNRIQRAHARELLGVRADLDQPAAFARLAEHYLHSAARAVELASAKRHERPELTPAGPWTVPLADVEGSRAWLIAERANVAAIAVEVEQNGRPKGLLRLARSVAANLGGGDRVIHQLPAREAGDSGLLPASSS